MKNPDFLSRNSDLLSRNPDFLLKNVDFIIKPGGPWSQVILETVLNRPRRGCFVRVVQPWLLQRRGF